MSKLFRAKAIKLSSQEEYNTERFKISQTNCESLRKQCSLLEEKNIKLNGIVAKHEAASETLRNEALEATTKLSQAQVQADFLRNEVSDSVN